MMSQHERAFIRHPADIPLEVSPHTVARTTGAVRNLSPGGLAFSSTRPYPIGSDIRLCIRCSPHPLDVLGQVMWCESSSEGYEVGIAFYSPNDAYHVRMVEQICQIEQYRQDAWRQEGRCLSQEQAAREWIDLYANQFAQGSWSE